MNFSSTSTLPFDLVILDLDGTILDLYRAKEPSPIVQETIKKVQALGIPVTIGTGRTLPYVQEYVAPLNITSPVVTTQGAVIGDPVTGQVLQKSEIPLAYARRVAQWLDNAILGDSTTNNPNRVSVFYFVDDDGKTHIYENRQGDDPAFSDHAFGLPRIHVPQFVDLLNRPDAAAPIKFITINNPAIEADIEPELQALFSPEIYITRTHPLLVEGTAQGISKGHGVLALCKRMGIDPQRVLAIGDADNDISMLEAVGFGVAMGNGSVGMKAVADWIAPPIEEEGAAVALQKFILSSIRSSG